MENISSFRIVFGDSPVVKIIDFFLDNREFDYGQTHIAKNTDVSCSVLYHVWENLVRLGILIKTRRVGKEDLYKLNLQNPVVKNLIAIDYEISKRMIDIDIEKQKIEISA